MFGVSANTYSTLGSEGHAEGDASRRISPHCGRRNVPGMDSVGGAPDTMRATAAAECGIDDAVRTKYDVRIPDGVRAATSTVSHEVPPSELRIIAPYTAAYTTSIESFKGLIAILLTY